MFTPDVMAESNFMPADPIHTNDHKAVWNMNKKKNGMPIRLSGTEISNTAV